jgi:hypothetical protein
MRRHVENSRGGFIRLVSGFFARVSEDTVTTSSSEGHMPIWLTPSANVSWPRSWRVPATLTRKNKTLVRRRNAWILYVWMMMLTTCWSVSMARFEPSVPVFVKTRSNVALRNNKRLFDWKNAKQCNWTTRWVDLPSSRVCSIIGFSSKWGTTDFDSRSRN